MFRYPLILLLLLFAITDLEAQEARLRGSVADSVNYKNMVYTTVSLTRSRDSVLVAHGWVNDKGNFELNHLFPDTYNLLISRPTFADYEERVILLENEEKKIPTVLLIPKATLLRDVLVREKLSAIRIKGDTTEYMVDSFLTNKSHNVEDLLKRLPGIQVDKDGKITAHGQTVKKVLVDGEEFFGEDPTVATRNLKAENIDKVQVFDKKSDQATLTGIDDGEKNKTINLTLKEDAKKGYFGKAEAAGGLQAADNTFMYENQAMFNSFRNKRKFSVYGAFTNTNKTGLNWEEAEQYTGGKGNTEYDMASGMMYTYYMNDDGDFNGTGIPQTWYMGTYYSNKYLDNKHAINGSASTKEIRVSGFDDNYTKTILPDTLFYSTQRKELSNSKRVNSGNFNYEANPDTQNTIRVKGSFMQSLSQSSNMFTSSNLNGNAALVNQNSRLSVSDFEQQRLNSSLMWNHKFAKKGRTFSIQLVYNHNNQINDGSLLSNTFYYDSIGKVQSKDSIDQKKYSSTQINTYNPSVSYTEPLSKTLFVVADYDFLHTLNNSERKTLRKDLGPEYNKLIDSLSSNYQYDITTNKGGLALKYVTKKTNASFGGRIAYTDLYQRNIVTDTSGSQHFFNLFPAATYNYKLKNTANLSLNYSGSTQQPTLQQLQPLQDNSNPLDIFKGNPNLIQSFRNRISLNYSSYKPISGSSVWSSFSFTQVNDDFTSNDYVDAKGRKVHQTINADGNYSASGYVHYGFKIKKLNMYVNQSANAWINRNVNYLNARENINVSQNAEYGLGFYYEKEDKMDLSLRGEWQFTNSSTSLRPDVVTQYWIYTYYADAEFELPKKFSLSADAIWNLRPKTSTFDRDLNTLIVNAFIGKKMLANDALEISFGVYDLLNQNLGFNRYASSNYINENTHSVLKQYFMFSITYNFRKGPADE